MSDIQTLVIHKGGEGEKSVSIDSITVPDARHAAMRANKVDRDLILEVWHLAHAMKDHLKEHCAGWVEVGDQQVRIEIDGMGISAASAIALAADKLDRRQHVTIIGDADAMTEAAERLERADEQQTVNRVAEVFNKQDAVNRFAAEFGLEIWPTGEGCTAFGLHNPDGSGDCIMVTSENDAEIPTEMAEHSMAGHYDNDGNQVAEIGAGLPFHELMNGPVNEFLKGWG